MLADFFRLFHIEQAADHFLDSRSPMTFHSLFGHPRSPLIPTFPEDIDFMFDAQNKHPETWSSAVKYQLETAPSLSSVFRHLDYLLAYTSTPSVPSLVQYTWSQLDLLAHTYDQAYKKIYLDPRFESGRFALRPMVCVNLLLTDATNIFATLWVCHLLLERYGSVDELSRESRSRLFASLGSMADHLSLVLVSYHLCSGWDVTAKLSCRNIVGITTDSTLRAFILLRRSAIARKISCLRGQHLIPLVVTSKLGLFSQSIAANRSLSRLHSR